MDASRHVRWVIQEITPDGWKDVRIAEDYLAARKLIHMLQLLEPKNEFRYVHEITERTVIPHGDELPGVSA